MNFQTAIANSRPYPQVSRTATKLFTTEPLSLTTWAQQLVKLRHEVDELEDCIEDNLAGYKTDTDVLEEFSDVLVCLVGAADKLGISWQALVTGLDAKLRVNISRTWTRQPDGTYQHD